jgi:ABC-2 type transport system permease protein
MRLLAHRGAALSTITGLIWYGGWCFLASLVYAVAAEANTRMLQTWVPAGLLVVCIYWQVVPILSASMGSALDMRKLLIYPAPHGRLFVVEVLLRLATALEMLLILVGGVTGLLMNPAAGGWRAAPKILTLTLMFVLFNLLLASGMRSLLERLLSYRRLREILIFLLLLGLTAPRLLFVSDVEVGRVRRLDPLIRFEALPWAAISHAWLGGSTLAALGVLACWTLGAAWFGRTQFERNLRYDAVAAQATPRGAEPARPESWSERFFRFPSLVLRDPLAGIVEKELRSLARTPRFRMVFVMGFSFGVMVWLPLVLGRGAERHGTLEQNFLVVVSVYALTLLGQVTYWNCFGFDRSAVQFYFAAPQPIYKTLLGKNLASLIFIYMEVVILIFITLLLRVGVGLGQMVEVVLVIAVCALYMMAFGNMSSVQYPRALTPERVSQGGASSRFQALVFLLYPITLLPVILAYLSRYAFNSETAFAVILALAAVIGGVMYWLGMESAVKTIATRRERILAELSRGEGPVASS